MQINRTSQRHGKRWRGSFAVVLLTVGCALPDYHQPRGFSSSYYRHLQQSQQFTPLAPVPVAEPATAETSRSNWYWPWGSKSKR